LGKVQNWLNISNKWQAQFIETRYKIPKTEILFERINKKLIEEEVKKLSL